MSSRREPRHCVWCGAALIRGVVHGEERLVCSSAECTYVHWNNPTPVVAAIIERGDEVVLVRNHGWPAKTFGLVTGFLEAGEDPAAAVVREVKEELGVNATVVGLVGVYGFAAMNQLIVAYHVTTSGDPTPLEEIAELKFIAKSKLKPWPFGTGHAVADWLSAQSEKIVTRIE